jgi:CheY-like chemotaxis protein
MPRLLLVDDNPSIHKIAETLLAASDVQLISCDSGAQAMALVNLGDRFDVALLDTSMLGMDGWTLLQQLREHKATAQMPVAMMAGVLDIVDPEKLRLAPIQGFLKKPVELRDLGDRVRRLMETPVPPPPPPPVLQAAPPPEAPPEAAVTAPFLTRPSFRVPDELKQAAVEAPQFAVEDDLLLLGPEDLFQEPPEEEIQEIPEAAAPAPPEAEPLDLEGLDLEGLQNLTLPASALPAAPAEAPAPAEEAQAPAAPAPTPEPTLEQGPAAAAAEGAPFTVPEFLLADTLPDLSLSLEPGQAYADQLPDLGPAMDSPGPGAPALLELGEPIDWSDDSDALVGFALGGPEPSAFPPEPQPPAPTPPATVPEVLTRSDILDPPPATAETPFAPTAPQPTFAELPLPAPAAELLAAEAAPDPLAGLLADPVLMDRLAKALVARLGDQVLREIAWEVMPELAERLHTRDNP